MQSKARGSDAELRWTEATTGRHIGDRYVRITRHRDFNRAGPGHIVATEAAGSPASSVGRVMARARRTLFGRPLASAEEARRRSPLQAVANFVLMAGALGLFNAVCIWVLGLLTELGVTTEATAKWAELDALTVRFFGVGVTAQTADTFGLQLVVVGVAVLAAGRVLAKASGER